MSHADGVVAVAPEGAGFPVAEKGPPQQPALRPKVFREALHNLHICIVTTAGPRLAPVLSKSLLSPVTSFACRDARTVMLSSVAACQCAAIIRCCAVPDYTAYLAPPSSHAAVVVLFDRQSRVCRAAKETLPRTEMPFWRTPVTDAEAAAHLHFNHVKERTPALRRQSRWYLTGIATFACWLAAFGFYLYVRIGRTMDSHSNVFAYQVRYSGVWKLADARASLFVCRYCSLGAALPCNSAAAITL